MMSKMPCATLPLTRIIINYSITCTQTADTHLCGSTGEFVITCICRQTQLQYLAQWLDKQFKWLAITRPQLGKCVAEQCNAAQPPASRLLRPQCFSFYNKQTIIVQG